MFRMSGELYHGRRSRGSILGSQEIENIPFHLSVFCGVREVQYRKHCLLNIKCLILVYNWGGGRMEEKFLKRKGVFN